jgi:hypothetical protein
MLSLRSISRGVLTLYRSREASEMLRRLSMTDVFLTNE